VSPAPTGEPLTARSRATRERLLALGMSLFAQQAYDELSIEDIAAAAQVSHGLLYHHFGSKRGFYLATLERAATEVEELAVAASQGEELPVRDRARAAIGARVDFIAARATGYRVVTQGGIGSDPEALEIVERTRRASVARALHDLGVAGDARVELAVHGWTGMFERALLRWLDEPLVGRDELVDLLADSLLATLAVALGGDATATPAGRRTS